MGSPRVLAHKVLGFKTRNKNALESNTLEAKVSGLLPNRPELPPNGRVNR